jgi:hypothetical protein
MFILKNVLALICLSGTGRWGPVCVLGIGLVNFDLGLNAVEGLSEVGNANSVSIRECVIGSPCCIHSIVGPQLY